MLGRSILTAAEKKKFRRIYGEDSSVAELPDHSKSLSISQSKFGFGVIATEDIPAGSFLGYYYGRLCRELPKHTVYSFELPGSCGGKRLFINAEDVEDRSILA